MKSHRLLYRVALLMIIVGILAWVRTDSAVPFVITGSIGIFTGILAYLNRNGSRPVYVITLVWMAAMVIVLGFQTFYTIGAHSNPQPGSRLIFGILAAAYLIALIVLVVKPPRPANSASDESRS